MIKVDRIPAPEVVTALAAVQPNGLTEQEWALWYYQQTVPQKAPLPNPPNSPPEFKAYKCKAVQQALQQMFGDRCCYCESQYGHVTSKDVEHFRPKNGWREMGGRLEKPGYYWLASAWENLLPSCPHCNRTGKRNFFPLAKGSPRAVAPGQECNEQALLLNPCVDDPSLHLSFTHRGFVGRAATDDEKNVAKGLTTIEVCKLDRDLLVERRRRRGEEILEAMTDVCETDRDLARSPGDQDLQAKLVQREARLKSRLSPTREYRALAQGMKDLFETTRPHAKAYYAAQEVLKNSPDNASALAKLTAAVGQLKGLKEASKFDPEFLDTLLRSWGVA